MVAYVEEEINASVMQGSGLGPCCTMYMPQACIQPTPKIRLPMSHTWPLEL